MSVAVDTALRDFVRYTGDGLPNAPVGAPLPIGDPSSGVYNPSKAELRSAIGGIVDLAETAAAQAAMYGGIEVFTFAQLAALTALEVSVGDIVRVVSNGVVYKRLASGGDLTHTASVLFWEVLPTSAGEYIADGFGDWVNANTCHNAVIAHANRVGSATVGVAPLTYVYSAVSYDLRTGTRTALAVQSVSFITRRQSVLRLRYAPFVLLGTAGVMTDATKISGFCPDATDVPIRKKSTVQGATQANPVVVTAVGHGFVTGDHVRLFDVGGMTQINDIDFAITVINADSFSLTGINGTGYGAFSSTGEVRPETDAALVKIVNASRVFISDIIPKRLPHIVKADIPAGLGTSDINVTKCRVYGHESYDWIALHTRLAAFGAGLFVNEVGGFPSNVAANPVIIPKVITGATQANPVVITCTGHGFTTGDNIRLCGVGGMAQIDSGDFTVTVINANSFSLNAINGTGYTAYTSGGWAVELHSSQPFDTGLVFINGKWDTAEMNGVLAQHYAWLWRLRTSGLIQFVWENGCTFDYGGKGRYQIAYGGNAAMKIEANGGWHWTLDDSLFAVVNGASAGVFIHDVKIDGMDIGMVGKDVLRDTFSNFATVAFTNIALGAMGRARQYGQFTFLPGASGKMVLANITSPLSLVASYGAGADTFLLPAYGFYNDGSSPNAEFSVVNCQLNGTVSSFAVPTALTASGPRKRMFQANRKPSGALPEYCVSAGATMPASAAVQTNVTGLVMDVALTGGTITSVSRNGVSFRTGTGSCNFSVKPGETWACAYSVAPTLVYTFGD